LFHEPVTETKLISFLNVCHIVNFMQIFSGFLVIGSSYITNKYGISLHLVMDRTLLYNVAFQIPHFFV